MKKKVVTVNCTGYAGSTGKLIADIDRFAGDEYEFVHYYQLPEKDVPGGHLLTGWNVTRFYYYLSRITGIKYGLGNIPTKRLIRSIQADKPDIVHIHCPNFYTINLYRLLDYLKRTNTPTVITNHAEFFYTGNCAHAAECEGYKTGCRHCRRQFDSVHPYIINRTACEWRRMKEALSNAPNITMVAVSGWVKERMSTSPIAQHLETKVVENGIDTEVFRHIDGAHKPVSRKRVLNVTAHFTDAEGDFKGGRYLIELAKMRPNYDFMVAGNYDIKDKENLPSNITLLGNITDRQELAALYNEADVTVLTSKRETFGMAYAESVCCGTKVAAFRAGGTESIALEGTAEFAEYGDTENLAQLTDEINPSDEDRRALSQKATEHFAVQRMVGEYKEIYNKILEQE